MSAEESLSLAEVCKRLNVTEAHLVEIAHNAGAFYRTFRLKKRRGGTRKIAAAQGELKHLQRRLLLYVLNAFEMPPHVHGCVKRRSVASNAEPHVAAEVVLRLDLAAFYDSIHFVHVRNVLARYLRVDDAAAELLAELTTYQNALPAGAPTSPVLANLVLLELDRQLMALLPAGVPYTRYLDDITVSGGKELVQILPRLAEVIERSGFALNDKKTRILRKSVRQSVTGVVVNTALNPPKTMTRRVRQYLYYCRKWGVQEHAEAHGVGKDTMIATIRGMIGYIGMIDPMAAISMHLEMNQLVRLNAETREEALLDVLQNVIDAEQVVEFDYDVSRREVAPSEVFVSNGRYPSMRGWQIQPTPGWRVYLLEEMSNVVVKEKPSGE